MLGILCQTVDVVNVADWLGFRMSSWLGGRKGIWPVKILGVVEVGTG